MIVRLWIGTVAAEVAGEYRDYQLEVGPPGYRTVPGNRVTHVLERELDGLYRIAMLTFWSSWEAVRAFAGDPVELARYYARDLDYLIDPPRKVEHFEVLGDPSGPEELAPGTVVRLWRSRIRPERLEEARRFELETGLAGYREVPGNLGAFVLERVGTPAPEVGMLSFWSSLSALRRFAGPDVERARYDAYEERGLDFLLDPPDTVQLFDVVHSEPGLHP